MYGLGVNKLGASNTGDPIAKLFAGGEKGAWYDISDLSTLFQEDGTTPAAVGQEVGKILDKSGNGNHLVQTVAAECPVLQVENGRYYLDFEGDEGLQTSANISFNSGDAITICAGVEKDIDATMVVAELSPNIGGNNGAFRLASITGGIWRYSSKGTNVINTNETDYPAGSKSVVVGLSDISDDTVKLRVDGVEEASSTSDQGTGPLGDYKLNVGARNDAGSLELDGKLYGLVVRGVVSNAAELAALESYMARKAGT